MSGFRNVCALLVVALCWVQPSWARDVPPLNTAPPGGQLATGKYARMIIPEGWNWVMTSGDNLISASPNVSTRFFALETPKLTDDMATCYDLSDEQSMKGASQSYLQTFIDDQVASQTTEMNKIDDVEARAVSFVEARTMAGVRMMVAVVPDDADRFGAHFTGIVYLETPAARLHLVCKAAFSKSNGPYAERPTLKAFLQLINSFAPL